MAKQIRLSQVVALEKTIKNKVNQEGGELLKQNQKAALFTGFTKQYERKNEEGEEYPPEKKLVQARAEVNLKRFGDLWSELLNITATKDTGNTQVSQAVMVGERQVLPALPVTYLIWLEKQLDDLKTFVSSMTELSPEEIWTQDESTGYYRSEAVKTVKTKKNPKVVVKFAPTEHQPGQAEMVFEDEAVGHWHKTELSGGIPGVRKATLLGRVDELRKAVKSAREEANSARIEEQEVAPSLLKFLLE